MKFIFCTLELILTLNLSAFSQTNYPKKVIQFGWDYPTITFIKNNIKKMEERPFDGVAFSFDFKIFDLFDTTVYPEKVFQFDDLQSISWGKLTNNFIRVRAQSLNGANWINDHAWENIIKNISNISKALEVSGSKGIFFDPEYYYLNLPDKNPWIYNQKLYPGMSYEEVGKYVRKRGEQFINSLQSYETNPEILATYLLSLVTLQARQKPISQTGMALYPFFVEGMMAGKNKETHLIDGNELGFSYRSERQYVLSGEEIRNWGVDLMPDSLKKVYKETTISQPIFYDLIFETFPQYKKNLSDSEMRNWLATDLYLAFKVSDEYVWFYNSNLDWWRKDNPEIAEIINNVKKRVTSEFDSKARTISGRSQTINFFTGENNNRDNFQFSYEKSTKSLTVEFNSDMESFSVFENSRPIDSLSHPAGKINLKLDQFSGQGNLILCGKDKKTQYFFSFLN